MLKQLTVVASLALVGAAMMASTAAAEGVTSWNVAGINKMNWAGTLTLKKNGGSAVTCTIKHTGSTANGEAVAEFGIPVWFPNASCSNGGSFRWEPLGYGLYDEETGKFSLSFASNPWQASEPWTGKSWWPVEEEVTVPFSNGSGSTPSTISFSGVKLGTTQSSESITVSGTINVTDPATKQAVTLSVK